MQPNLVIIRHGQSQFNLENRFAGWIDTDLTLEGERQAKAAAETLAKAKFKPDVIYVSPFTRAKRTAQFLYPGNDLKIEARVAERFYGGLSGKNKEETLKEIGDEMFLKIRRGYDTAPPNFDKNNREYKTVIDTFEKLIKGTFTNELPVTESLKDVEARVKPWFETTLKSDLKSGKKVLVVAHGNSLRALIKLLKNISPEEIAHVELETAQPAGFVIDENLKVKADSVGKPFAEMFK